MTTPRRLTTLLAAIAAGLLVPAAAFAQTAPAAPAAPSQTIEMRLAAAEEGDDVSPLDPLLDQFAEMLDGLEARCSESREQLGNQALIAYDFAGDDETLTPMRILQRVRAAVPPTATMDKPVVCGGYFLRIAREADASPVGSDAAQ